MRLFTKTAAALALAFSMGTASATIATIDLGGAGAFSCDGPGATCNLIATIDLGAIAGGIPVALTGVGWDLTIETVGFSYLSEAVISFQDSAGEIFSLTAGAGDFFPGTGFYSSGGIVDLQTALGFIPEFGDGLLTLEFYESFDDVSGAIDAFYLDPSFLTLEFESLGVPAAEPGILVLFGLGLIGVVVARRRA